MKKKMIYIIIISGLALLASACAGAPAEPITSEPTNTPIPSPTPVPPTDTAIPPTETAVPSATPPPVDPGLLAYLEVMIANEVEADSHLIDLIIERVLKNPSAVVASIGPKLGDSNQSEASLAVYAWVLGVTQDPAAIDPLVELAKDTTSTWVKRNCIRSIGSIGGEQAGQGLLSLLEQITDKDQRYEILNILAEMQYEPALPVMGEILAVDPNQEFWKPIFIFGKMGDLGVPYLLTKINDDDVNIRTNSISQLGRLLIAPEAAQPLQEHYWVEEDPGIRGLILSSLEMIAPDLETMQSFAEEVIKKEKDPGLVNYAQETIDSLPDMRTRIDSFISEKRVSAPDFEAAYSALYDNYGYGDNKALANTSTLEDEVHLKKLRERTLQRDSDEALHDYFEVNEIIRLNRLAQAVAEQKGKPWEAWPTATPQPTPPPVLESDSLPPPSQSVFVSANDLVFSPNGNYIAASGFGSYDFAGITILDASTLNQTNTLDQFDTTDLDQFGESTIIDDLAFNPDGTQLAITTSKADLDSLLWGESLWIWDLDSPQAELLASENLVPNQGHFLGFSPGGSLLIWGFNNTLRLFDGVTGIPLEDQPDLPALDIRAVAISPDGNLMGICCSESAIILWDMQKNQVIGEIPDAPFVQTLIFTPDGEQLVAFDPRTQQINYWDSKTQKPIMPSIKLAGHPNIYKQQSRISPDGRFLASIYSIREDFPANLLAVFDARTGEPIGSTKCEYGCDSIAFSPDGKSIALLNSVYLQVWEMDSITK